MTRLSCLLLLCLACGSYETDGSDDGLGDPLGGSGGSVSVEAGSGGLSGSTPGGAGVGAAETGGVSGSATGGASPSGGASPGGVSSGGAAPTGGTAQCGSSTGGFATGGTATGWAGSGGAAGSGGSAGALLWSREFTYSGAIVAGDRAKHELVIYRVYPSEVCLRITLGDVPHGQTGAATGGVGDTLIGCLSQLVGTDPSRHAFYLEASGGGTTVTGGGVFDLPANANQWRPRSVVRRVTQNDWSAGAVSVRETWEFRE